MKTGLSKNLIKYIPNKVLSEFYPRTYDLSSERERFDFENDYE